MRAKYVKGKFVMEPIVLKADLENSEYVYVTLGDKLVDKCRVRRFLDEYVYTDGRDIHPELLIRLGNTKIEVRKRAQAVVEAQFKIDGREWEVNNYRRIIGIDRGTFYKCYSPLRVGAIDKSSNDVKNIKMGHWVILTCWYMNEYGAFESEDITSVRSHASHNYYLGTKPLFSIPFEEEANSLGEVALKVQTRFETDSHRKVINFRVRERKTGKIEEFQV